MGKHKQHYNSWRKAGRATMRGLARAGLSMSPMALAAARQAHAEAVQERNRAYIERAQRAYSCGEDRQANVSTAVGTASVEGLAATNTDAYHARPVRHCVECGLCPHEHCNGRQDHKPTWHKSNGPNVSADARLDATTVAAVVKLTDTPWIAPS